MSSDINVNYVPVQDLIKSGDSVVRSIENITQSVNFPDSENVNENITQSVTITVT